MLEVMIAVAFNKKLWIMYLYTVYIQHYFDYIHKRIAWNNSTRNLFENAPWNWLRRVRSFHVLLEKLPSLSWNKYKKAHDLLLKRNEWKLFSWFCKMENTWVACWSSRESGGWLTLCGIERALVSTYLQKIRKKIDNKIYTN